ncbi:MAG: hypothetical protein HYT93_01045 [Parcubacteria group bacterium]|nr:hypothetical protein [Parcubacteria group bacterium]
MIQDDVCIDHERIQAIARTIASIPEHGGTLNFHSIETPQGARVLSDMYPDVDDAHAIDFFFFAILHDHGFWFGDDAGYVSPLYGTILGKNKVKGSDLLWKSLKRSFDKNPTIVTIERLLKITPEEFADVFSDDNGPIPFPDWEARYMLTKQYAQWFLAARIKPKDMLLKVRATPKPLLEFRNLMRVVPGYTDPFNKKTLLLAMVLSLRPEKFLSVTDTESWDPIIDYHLMRLALRMGIVAIPNSNPLYKRLTKRNWVNADEELFIRQEVYQAMKKVLQYSRKPLAFVDYAFWSGRKFCPEMTEPNCRECPFQSVCAKKTELFQPIFRTLNY